MILTQEEFQTPEIFEYPELTPGHNGKLQYLAWLASQPGGMEVIIELGPLASANTGEVSKS